MTTAQMLHADNLGHGCAYVNARNDRPFLDVLADWAKLRIQARTTSASRFELTLAGRAPPLISFTG
jgi:hypothetical protein